MAVKKNAECEIIIKVETGTTSTGKASYSIIISSFSFY